MVNQIITVLGKKGSGKSYFTRNKILPKLPRPVFVIDAMGEYDTGIIFQSGDDLENYLLLTKPNETGIYILRPENDADIETLFGVVYAIGNCSLIAEEASIYCNPYYINPEFKKIINYGRHKQINLVAIARRASEIHRDITAQSDFVVSFRQTERRDIDALSRIDEQKSELVKVAKKYKPVIFGDKENDILKLF